MDRLKPLLILLLSVILVFQISGCAAIGYSVKDFYGGETLTPEKMQSMIENHFFEKSLLTMPQTDSHGDFVVFWTSGGQVWHYFSDCPSISSSSEIFSGKSEDAQKNGKTRPCSRCSPDEEIEKYNQPQ
ncbi:MAG: hypothetical protein MJ102_00450 [Clostridia bacterium]|nr:hypothetical protein [Clostridia bacterium]